MSRPRGPRPDISMVPGTAIPKPDNMSADAERIWDELAPVVPNLGDGHGRILSDFCHCLAELEKERAELAKEGTIIKTNAGRVKNARLQAVRELRTAVQRYACDFGLNPTASYRLAGDKGRTKDPGEGLLDGEWQPDEPDAVH